LIDALLKTDGQEQRLPEFQQLDNLALAEEALAVSRNASFWALVRSVVDLKPVYRRQITTGTEYNIDEMRNGLIVLLHKELAIDVGFLQELTNGKLVAAIPKRLVGKVCILVVCTPPPICLLRHAVLCSGDCPKEYRSDDAGPESKGLVAETAPEGRRCSRWLIPLHY